MADFSAGFNLIGGAVSDLFEAKGQRIAAKGYDRAAALTEQSADLARVASNIRLRQTSREAYRIIGGQQSDVAGAGFAQSGSALDLLRSSQSEAALELGLVQTQGAIDVLDYTATAEGYRTQASQSRSSAKGSVFGAILKGVAAVGAIAFSDRRLKRDITRIGIATNGLKIYRFRYLWSDTWQLGFMADEVQARFPDAVSEVNGFLVVDYLKATRYA